MPEPQSFSAGRRWERIVLALLACSLVYQVLCEPIVGTADNRDYWRVMRQAGLSYIENRETTIFANIQRKFKVSVPSEVSYLTSQVPIARVARALNGVLSKDGLFDIRVMGATNGLFYLAAVWTLLCAFARRTWPARVSVGVSALVFFSDVRIVSYFNSFLSESAQVIWLLSTLGCALLANDEKLSTGRRWLAYGGFLASSLAFLVAKSQDLAFAPTLAWIGYAILPSASPLRAQRIVVALALCAIVPWTMFSGAYASTTGVNARVTAKDEIMAHSDHPEQDLAELGGNVRTVKLRAIAKFYARHPDRWWKMARRRTRETHTYVEFGNFELPMSGLSVAFDEWSEWKRVHYPRKLRWWLVALVAYAGLLSFKFFKRDATREQRNNTLLHAALLLGLVLQFIVVVTFEANGTEKHFFIFNVLADLMVVFCLFDVAYVARAQLARSRASSAEPPIRSESESMAANASSENSSG